MGDEEDISQFSTIMLAISVLIVLYAYIGHFL